MHKNDALWYYVVEVAAHALLPRIWRLSVCEDKYSYPLRVFSPPSSDDEMKDLLLQRRFRMLNWLEPKHLDVPLNLANPSVQEQILKGQQGQLV